MLRLRLAVGGLAWGGEASRLPSAGWSRLLSDAASSSSSRASGPARPSSSPSASLKPSEFRPSQPRVGSPSSSPGFGGSGSGSGGGSGGGSSAGLRGNERPAQPTQPFVMGPNGLQPRPPLIPGLPRVARGATPPVFNPPGASTRPPTAASRPGMPSRLRPYAD